jgi:NADPH:quinone reductase-like Zn-dependent oxidoreductase
MDTRQDITSVDGNTMKAIVQDGYGLPEDQLELRDTDAPLVGEDQVLLRVQAVGVAIGDRLIMTGQPYIARPGYGLLGPKHRIPGIDVAGVVEAIGRNVTGFQLGDEVFGWCDGALAEYVAVRADALVSKPANLTSEQAAAVPTSAFAALQALRDTGQIHEGQQVLILGASGGVGTFAVQIAKSFGAEVTGVCSTRNVDMVRSLGADHVVDYTREAIAESGRRYDLILDLAGNRSLSDLRSVLANKGTLVIVGGSGGAWFMGFGRTLRAAMISPFVGQRLRPFFSKPNQEDLVVLRALLESGHITPLVDRTFPLSAIAAAMAYIGQRHTQGKTVITV